MAAATPPSKIFYSNFVYDEETKKTVLIFSTDEDQGFYIYDMDSKEKKFIETYYYPLIVEQVPGTKDFLVIGNDNTKVIKIVKESVNYEKDVSFHVKDCVIGMKVTRKHVILEYSSSIEVLLLSNFADVKYSQKIHAVSEKRRSSLCAHPSGIVAFNGENPGEVTLCDLRGEKPNVKTFNKHNNPVRAISISPDGTTVASISKKGTYMKIYKTPLFAGSSDFEYVCEKRRGESVVDVYSIAFTPNAKLVSLISSSGTVHVFYSEHCWLVNEYASTPLGKGGDNFVNIAFLDDKNVCLFYHKDGSLSTSSIDKIEGLKTNCISII